MTTVYGSFDPPLGQSEAKGVIVFTPKVEIDTVEGFVPRVARGVRLIGGEFSTNVIPGPYWMETRIVGSKDWAKKRSVVVPDQESIEVDELLGGSTNWEPQVVGAAQQARDAAIAAKNAAEEILGEVEAGVVPDSAVASKITDPATATRAAIDARITALGDTTYAPKTIESTIADKYTKPSGGIPLADLKVSDLDSSYAPKWKASTAYAENALVLLPAPINGPGTRNTAGTSRSTFDSTEQALWTATATATVDGLTDASTIGKAVAKAADAATAREAVSAVGRGDLFFNPYDYGATGDGTTNDTAAVQAAYDAAAAVGGSLVLPKGEFNISGGLTMATPGVSLVGHGGIISGGEVVVGPATYSSGSGGVDFSGTRIRSVVFDRGDDYGSTRQLVLRNVRGLDIEMCRFQSAGKGIAIEQVDGNTKFHTVAMIRISGCRFGKLKFGIYGDTDEWDRLSDWQITDNYFNYCSDTSVWIASTTVGQLGGLDGLNFAGNTIFSLNYNSSTNPLFAQKRYNLRLGKTNWLRIVNNNFFESGLSAVYLDTAQNFNFVGNHVAWPGQREFGDCLEMRNGSPKGVIEGNTFALWTRAGIGLYDFSSFTQVEVGQNSWNFNSTPDSWKGGGSLGSTYRVFASSGGSGYPIVRDFSVVGAYDSMKGNSRIMARDVKSAKGGVTGFTRRSVPISGNTAVSSLADIMSVSQFGGALAVTVTNSSDSSLMASYLLFVVSQGDGCTQIASGGYTAGAAAGHPSFTWSVASGVLRATPVGSTSGSFNVDITSLGAVMPG